MTENGLNCDPKKPLKNNKSEPIQTVICWNQLNNLQNGWIQEIRCKMFLNITVGPKTSPIEKIFSFTTLK